jgi:hypothetical protein
LRFYNDGTDPWYKWALELDGSAGYLQANERFLADQTPDTVSTRIVQSVDELMDVSQLSGYERERSMTAYLLGIAVRWRDLGAQGYPMHGEVAAQLWEEARYHNAQALRLAPPPPPAPPAAAADGPNLWNRGWSALADGGDWLINHGLALYNRGRDAEERLIGPDPLGYGTDVAVGFVSTLGRAVTGTFRAVGDPQSAVFGVARGLDSILLDSRPASQVVSENWARLRSSSAREIAMGTGEVAGDIFLIAGPAKLGAGRLAFASEANAFAGLEPLGAAERAVVGSGPGLLPGEGMVGTYDDLIAAGVKGDNITPHHIPSANRMALEGVSKGDGIAINMEQPFPGAGGRHRATFTYGTKADIDMTPRQALAAGVWDARRIYRADGLYTPQIRSSLQDLIRMNKANHSTIFVKQGR